MHNVHSLNSYYLDWAVKKKMIVIFLLLFSNHSFVMVSSVIDRWKVLSLPKVCYYQALMLS